MAKRIVESDPNFFIAGDSAYPISRYLMKPYPIREAHRDRVKRRFNFRLSQIRSVMTETMFGQWKGQWPYITNMRSHLQLSQKIIIATAILFNIKKEWEGQTTSEPYEVPTIRPRVQLSAREILQDGKRQREIITQAMQPI